MFQNKKPYSYFKIGAICASIVSASYVIITILALFSPVSVMTYHVDNKYFSDFQSYENFFILLKCLFIVTNASLVGVVIAIHKLKESKNKGVLTLFSVLAIVGLGIGMLQSVKDATRVPHLAKSYKISSPEIKDVIITFGVANPAIYTLSLGLPAIWFIVMSICCRNVFSKLLVFLGIMWGTGSILIVLAHLFIITWLFYFIEAGALFMAPVWGIAQTHFFWKFHKNTNRD
jgi:hypothetical protein